jgi:hypothetical protein
MNQMTLWLAANADYMRRSSSRMSSNIQLRQSDNGGLCAGRRPRPIQRPPSRNALIAVVYLFCATDGAR